jgi:hypothetical protein
MGFEKRRHVLQQSETSDQRPRTTFWCLRVADASRDSYLSSNWKLGRIFGIAPGSRAPFTYRGARACLQDRGSETGFPETGPHGPEVAWWEVVGVHSERGIQAALEATSPLPSADLLESGPTTFMMTVAVSEAFGP